MRSWAARRLGGGLGVGAAVWRGTPTGHSSPPRLQTSLHTGCNVRHNWYVTMLQGGRGCAGSSWSSACPPGRPAIAWRSGGSCATSARSPWPRAPGPCPQRRRSNPASSGPASWPAAPTAGSWSWTPTPTTRRPAPCWPPSSPPPGRRNGRSSWPTATSTRPSWPKSSGWASSPWPSSRRRSTAWSGCAAGGATSKPATHSPSPRPPAPSSASSTANSSWTPTPSRSTGPSTSPWERPTGPTMRDWLTGLAVAVGLMVASWGLLILLARRLPPGPLRELARFIPDCLTTVGRLRRDPRVPRRAKVAIVLAGLWLASPIDLIPEFLPVIGPLDDVVVVALALRYAGRKIPRQVLLDAWPGETRLLERLLGPARR